jgi:hypothetical protein
MRVRTIPGRCVTCCPQIEVEVWPAQAEVTFRDDRAVNPINTQVRFEAAVYNGCCAGVRWEVLAPSGLPGAGTIDVTGRYLAPAKGLLPSGTTDLVVATSIENPLRKAFAWVTLVGVGPAAVPEPLIAIRPKSVYLYYPQNAAGADRNEFIDASNTMQMFRASVRNTSAPIEWLVNGAVTANPGPADLFLYRVNGSGVTSVVVVGARLSGQPGVIDEAKVVQINYRWP